MATGLVLADQVEQSPAVAVGLRAAAELTPRNAALHRNFEQSARDLQRDIVRVVYYLERLCHHRVHTTLGFRRIEDYAAAVAGYTPAQTQRLLRMGRRLQRFPDVARALGSGGLSFAKAMLICTYTTPQQQREMVEAARGLTVRQLRLQLVGSVSPAGDHAAAGVEPGGEVGGAGIVAVGGCANGGRVVGGGAGPASEGSAGSQAVGPAEPVGRDDSLVMPESEGGGGAEVIGPDSVGPIDAERRCTTKQGPVQPDDTTPGRASGGLMPERSVEPRRSRSGPTNRTVISGAPRQADDAPHYLTLRLTAEQWQRWNAIMDHERRRTQLSPVDIMLCGLAALRQEPSAGASGVPYLVVMLACPQCGQARLPTREGDIPAPPALVAAAACDAYQEDDAGQRQSTVPPRQRRLALQRAHYRCEAPRCRQTRMLEIHHRRPIAAGGTHELDNLLVLCWRCHRRLHEADLAAARSLRQAPA